MTLPTKIETPKTHIISTFSGNKHFITAEQEAAVRKLSCTDQINTDTGIVRIMAIKEILPIETYYSFHPEEVPHKARETELPKTQPFNKKRYVRALEQMIVGFKRHFQGRGLPEKSQSMLDNMEKRLDNVYTKANEGFTNPVRETIKQFYGD